MTLINRAWLRLHRSARALRRDRRGVAAIEFAMIFPLMLVTFFGTVEFCSAVAIDRKVTLIARTLSDLTSQQGSALTTSSIPGIFVYGLYIITAYSSTPLKGQISEIYVDSNGKAKIQWTQGATYSATTVTLVASTRNVGDDVTSVVPTALLVKQTYLIFSEVNYQYVPVVTWGLMSTSGIALSDVSYTRPRQNTCVVYNNLPALVSGNCPST